MTSYGDSFFDGPSMQAAKGPLIGGGLTQLGTIMVKKFMPSMAKHASLIGLVLGAGVSGFLMTKPQHKETGAAGLATALIVGVPPLLDEYLGVGLLKGADDDMSGFGAITPEMGAITPEMGAEAMEMMDVEQMSAAPVEVMGSLGAITPEMGATPDGISIQGGLESAIGSSF